jgi:hypothetical protein
MARADNRCLTDEVFACGVDVCGRSPLDPFSCAVRKRWALPYGVSLAARGSCGDVAARERRGGIRQTVAAMATHEPLLSGPTYAAGT